MIYGFTHPGSGIGNQLHRYVATRVAALNSGREFSMIGREYSKVKDFMNLDHGPENEILHSLEPNSGKILVDPPVWEEKTEYYNPEFNFLENDTIIDGEFQDERYFEDWLFAIDEWFRVEPIKIADDTCAIGFRGGEFYVFPELGLPLSYWEKAIGMMVHQGIRKFEVHTDDPVLAKQFFPNLPITQNAGINWRSIRHAKHSIIANSSFYIFPRLLQHYFDDEAVTIAPRYWARRNTKEWSKPQNYYSCFHYI